MPKLYLERGQLYEIELPYSEVCMHMHVAGKPMLVELVGERSAQLYECDGRLFSAPVLAGEAGIYQDEAGYYIHRKEQP